MRSNAVHVPSASAIMEISTLRPHKHSPPELSPDYSARYNWLDLELYWVKNAKLGWECIALPNDRRWQDGSGSSTYQYSVCVSPSILKSTASISRRFNGTKRGLLCEILG